MDGLLMDSNREGSLMTRMTSLGVMLVLLLGGGVVLAQEGLRSEGREPRSRQMRDWAGGGREERRPRGHQRKPQQALTEEEANALYKVLEEINPELLERVKKWREVDSPYAMVVLGKMRTRFRHLMRLKETDPVMYDLKVQDLKYEMQSQAMAKEAAQSQDKQAKLKAILALHFDVRQKIRERDMEKLRQRVAELEKQIQARRDNREQLIEQRFKELSRQSRKASW